MNITHDVLIIGGGLVGASLAIALDGAGLRVGLAEAVPARANLQPSYDERNLALARATVNALTALGVWTHVSARATPIRRIHVSRQGEFGAARFEAAKHGVEAFGAVLPARELGNGLLARLDACATLVRHAPATLTAIEPSTDAIEARIETGTGERLIAARLIVGADGTGSFVRSALGIETSNVDYAQTAFVTAVTPQRQLDGCAYERFTASGPVALLPLADRRAGVVLTVPRSDASRVAALDDDGFLALLHERFGWRLGRLTRPGRRVSYPLQRVQSMRLTAARAVLVGNAAQTLHPIGAQGFNLGLRDALTLAELLVERVGGGGDPGARDVLDEYARRRCEDRDGTIAMSDGLVRLTANEAAPLKMLRSLGLIALDRVPALQAEFVRRGMGFRGHVPQLALRDANQMAPGLAAGTRR
ncbi:MAG TPA: 2-octaprenyl-6-methoxyphenyl hydroxylase [Rudaea sp.]|jgi:2-octaprenyl-6-methoxyphenol hydroxylase|nr:2-octaprenyl-6-methoxyphenyl hydroxylase [Rudaea sp.]